MHNRTVVDVETTLSADGQILARLWGAGDHHATSVIQAMGAMGEK